MDTFNGLIFRQAEQMFTGGSITSDPGRLKQQYIALAKRHHHDAGGSARAMADVNAANSALEKQARYAARRSELPQDISDLTNCGAA